MGQRLSKITLSTCGLCVVMLFTPILVMQPDKQERKAAISAEADAILNRNAKVTEALTVRRYPWAIALIEENNANTTTRAR